MTLAMVAIASIIYGCMSMYFTKKNRRRKGGLEGKKAEGKTEEEIAEMGDESPRYGFTV